MTPLSLASRTSGCQIETPGPVTSTRPFAGSALTIRAAAGRRPSFLPVAVAVAVPGAPSHTVVHELPLAR